VPAFAGRTDRAGGGRLGTGVADRAGGARHAEHDYR
jgi:hypothetical protein